MFVTLATRAGAIFFVELPSRLKEVENIYMRHTVVVQKSGSPVDMVVLPRYLISFAGFDTSQVVVWDFFHQQYVGEHFGNKFWI